MLGIGPGADPAAEAEAPRSAWFRILHFWRSPPDQPGWARPALLAIAALATLSYAWGIDNVNLETFYGAAARSMSESWHNFFFASFDPWGTVSVDKLPGAFWIQALSLRIFGFHLWAIGLPQVIEGTLTVLVLYRVVRLVAGPGAGLVAAVVLAASPATVLLNRGNISDSLLILLLVLAADATMRALRTGRWSSLVLAGVWVGLAFQAKMLQAWIVLPALYMAYVLAAPTPSLYRRLGHVVLSGLAVLVVSLSGMTAVSVVPAHDRPFVDGSCNNSLFSQVFLYNAADRLTGDVLTQPGCNGESPPLVTAAEHNARAGIGTVGIPGGPFRFLTGPFGRDDAWVLVPSLVALVALLYVRRRERRTDPLRAATVLWAIWLVFTWSFFASSQFLNSYYLAALVPPMAALCGMGWATAWQARSRRSRLVVMATVAAGAAYAVALLPADAGVRAWVIATTLVATAAAVAVLALSLRSGPATWLLPVGLTLSSLALLLGAAWASATAVTAGLGPFDTPYQSAKLTALLQSSVQKGYAAWPAVDRYADTFPRSVAVDTFETSSFAAFDVLATGREFLPLGGFTGRVPDPTLDRFIADVAGGKVRRVFAAVRPETTNPDMRWAIGHCARVRTAEATVHQSGVTYQRYLCAQQAHRAVASAPAGR